MANSDSQCIFFVDDEANVRQVVVDTLEQSGLHVSSFACPIECLEQLPAQRCDLLITDLRLPEIDGIELLKRSRVIAPWLPVMVITGYGDISTAIQAIKAGAIDFVEKPLDKISFLKKVRSIIQDNGNHSDERTGTPLTRSERRVLRFVLDGKSNKEIAALLSRSRRTIEVHRAHVMHKLGAADLIDLVKRTAGMMAL